jgi:hypothetical protein
VYTGLDLFLHRICDWSRKSGHSWVII